MMQECPKCGFLQPQDRFCANCGLDIENYQPTPSPWYGWLSFKSIFRITAVVLTIGVMVTYVVWRQTQKIDQIPSPQFVGDDNSREKKVGTSPASVQTNNSVNITKEKQRAANTSTTNESMRQNPQVSSLNKASLQKEEEKKVDTKLKKKPSNLMVRFAEFPIESLNQIFSEAHILHESTQIKVGLYKFQSSLSDLIKKNPQSRFLPGKEKKPLTGSGVHIEYTKPLSENDQHMQGLTFNVNFVNLNPSGLEIETSGRFYLNGESPDQNVNISLNGNYVIDNQSILIMAGIIPHRPFSEKETTAFNKSPIEIMNSQEFLAKETEFVLLLKTGY